MSNNDEKLIRSFLNSITIVSEHKKDLYFILVPLILSRQFFKRSIELKTFVESVLKITDIKDYAYSSRSVLLGRIMKHVSGLSIEEAVLLNNKVNKFIADSIKANEVVELNIKNNKKKPNVSYFSNWYNYIENLK